MAVVDAPPPRRVLVVDDQRDVADMFASLLESLGQDVQVAYDGAGALTLASAQRPRVAFLDVSMPDMSGSELARRLRQAFPRDRLTLVAVTGHDRNHPAVRRDVFDHHLLKPVGAEDLASLLRGLPVEPEP